MELQQLIDTVRDHFEFDLSAYRPAIVQRQVEARMKLLKIPTVDEYCQYLCSHDHKEYVSLAASLCANLTGFFRDVDEWSFLQAEVIPELVSKRCGHIRVWCAGCSTGQEAYSLAISFADAIGVDDLCKCVTIFATDIDERLLKTAKQGEYSADAMANVSAEHRAKYFRISSGNRFVVDARLRRAVVFLEQSVLLDSPILNTDLICCRNLLMYFNSQMQSDVMSKFDQSLKKSGFLFVGRAEAVPDSVFERVNHHQIFRHRERNGAARRNWRNQKFILMKRAFEVSPCPQIIMDSNGLLVAVNRKARELFGMNMLQCGERIDSLPAAGPLASVLRKIERMTAHEERLDEIEFDLVRHGRESSRLRAEVVPIPTSFNNVRGTLITFHRP